MKEYRLIPILLLSGNGFVKTSRFKNPTYLGDAINTIKIFNSKGVDELVILDINASKSNNEPNFKKLSEITTESFVPISYGGGIKSLEHASKILNIGYEKVILNTFALQKNLLKDISNKYGSSSTAVCVDYKKLFFGGYSVKSIINNNLKNNIVDYCKFIEDQGAGEIILQSIDRDGMYSGYDCELIKTVTSKLSIPVVAAGGASKLSDFTTAIKAGASAVAAGSFFVFKGVHKAVLITYPSRNILKENFYEKS